MLRLLALRLLVAGVQRPLSCSSQQNIKDEPRIDSIIEAEVEAVDMINLMTKRPDIRMCHEGNERLCREIGDLLSIHTFQKCLDHLPMYVSSNPDSMPSLRLYAASSRSANVTPNDRLVSSFHHNGSYQTH